jgi:hypothetical protein
VRPLLRRLLAGLLVSLLMVSGVALVTAIPAQAAGWLITDSGNTSVSTTLDVTPASPAAAGTQETLTATVTPAAAGMVQFKDGIITLGDPVTVTAGTASMPITLVPGSHSLTAIFTPADTTASRSSMSPEVSYLVNAAATCTTLDVTQASPAAAGTYETLTATVTPSVAGSVVFTDGTTPVGEPVAVTGATASMTTALASGTHSLTAVFTPADTVAFSPSTSPAVSYLVGPTATSTTLDLTPAFPAAGTVQILTATVIPTAAGTVQFKDGTTTLAAPVTVTAGKASMPTILDPGSHSLAAVFTPTDPAAFGPSTSAPATLTIR